MLEVYTSMAPMRARYTAGKLPKAFKILPALANWQDVLWLTRPDEWSPHAVFAATRMFASNLDVARAQLFYKDVLYERVRDDIAQHGRLNYHLYAALKKALFKPQPWIKAILLPLARANCTLREAVIVGSVVAKVSIPPQHGAVALLKVWRPALSLSLSLSFSLSRG